jgi:hypothetical protein
MTLTSSSTSLCTPKDIGHPNSIPKRGNRFTGDFDLPILVAIARSPFPSCHLISLYQFAIIGHLRAMVRMPTLVETFLARLFKYGIDVCLGDALVESSESAAIGIWEWRKDH